jgi:competence protein ComEA
MTETGFDWRRLTGSETEAPAGPPRPDPTFPVARIMAIAAVVGAGVVVSVVLAVGTPTPTVIVGADGSGLASPVDAGAGPADERSDGAQPVMSPVMLIVDVDGAVARPGLVTLPQGSRVGDAIAMAGGFTAAADARAAAGLNLAAPLLDGAQVTVPDRAGTVSGGSTAPSLGPTSAAGGAPGAPTVIDLDHATLAELDTLPGVGPVTANKILAARDEAPFQRPDDLLARKLVGPATFEKIKALVTADGR